MQQLDNIYFRRLVENDRRAIMITGIDNKVLYTNKKFSSITGYCPDEMLGKTPKLLSSNLHSHSFYQQMWLSLESHGHWEGLIWNRRKNGETYPQWLNINSIDEGGDRIFAAVFIDVGEIANFDSKVTAFAYYDELTELPNRILFCEILEAHVQRNEAVGIHFAVIYIDVDFFKNINDLHGHAVGDKVLVEVGRRLKSSLRENDVLARLSGDEFAAIVSLGESPEILGAICQRLSKAVLPPLSVAGRSHHVSVSIGTAVFPNDGVDSDDLLEKADKAMYTAKAYGRARVCAYGSQVANEVI